KPSTKVPISTVKNEPPSRKNTDRSTAWPPFTKWPSTIREIRKLTATAPMPMGAPGPGRRVPNSRMTKKAAAGSDGTSQANRINGRPPRGSPFHEVHVVDVDALSVAVDQDHDGQADPDLARRDGDHEQGEDLPGDL